MLIFSFFQMIIKTEAVREITSELKDVQLKLREKSREMTSELKDVQLKLLEKSISFEKILSKLEILRIQKAAIDLDYMHTRSMLTVRHLLERMEDLLGRPGKPRFEKWVEFLRERADTEFVRNL